MCPQFGGKNSQIVLNVQAMSMLKKPKGAPAAGGADGDVNEITTTTKLDFERAIHNGMGFPSEVLVDVQDKPFIQESEKTYKTPMLPPGKVVVSEVPNSTTTGKRVTVTRHTKGEDSSDNSMSLAASKNSSNVGLSSSTRRSQSSSSRQRKAVTRPK